MYIGVIACSFLSYLCLIGREKRGLHSKFLALTPKRHTGAGLNYLLLHQCDLKGLKLIVKLHLRGKLPDEQSHSSQMFPVLAPIAL